MNDYEKMINEPFNGENNLVISVDCPWWKFIRMTCTTGFIGFENHQKSGASSEFNIYLLPETVDILINKLQIAKNTFLEKNK